MVNGTEQWENGDVKQTEWQLGEQAELNVSTDRCSLSPGLEVAPLVSTNGWTFFVLCAKTVLPNWPVDISERKRMSAMRK